MFSKVLVANRGEIAIRVMRTLEEMGIGSVAVYSEPDRDAPHARRADEAYLLGPGAASESYLVVEKIIDVAKESGAEAIHPGYGFLAENAAFARACEEADIVFIGPPADAIDAMGSKTKARELMKAAGVPIVPGTTDPVKNVAAAKKIIDKDIGYPIAVKAAGGGGGKGFRVAESEDELEKAFEGASREGDKFFSDPTVYIERYLPDPRHVEVQVLADSHGNVVRLLRAAPAPEADRGEPGARRRPRTARADREDRHGGCEGRELPVRRNNRGTPAGRRVLLPRDEHTRSGRALRHRDGDRHRHRARAGEDRRR
jgi:acetyl-CoA/propionyl-CoA carboxylase biotin carboxyl carrier protein